MTEKNTIGRPVKISEKLIEKLEDIFKKGASVSEACGLVNISTKTFYNWQNNNEDFQIKMTSARQYADIMAKKIVIKKIVEDKDLATAKWWLEKREFRNSDGQTNLQINVPILDGRSIKDNAILGDLKAE